MNSLLNQIADPKPGQVIVIAGPTASGKTNLAIELGLKFKGEVISADSRQVYRSLNIGSAKVKKSEMCGIPHHLIDILDPGQKYNARQFQRQALSLIKDIQGRGNLPIICGGTGLYIESVVEGYKFNERDNLTPGSSPDPSPKRERASLTRTQSKIESAPIQFREGIRPESFSGSDQKSQTKSGYDSKFQVYLLKWPRDELRRRISTRVDQRIKSGMLEEVQNLLQSGVDPQWLISLGLEYRYLTEHLLDPNSNLEDILTKLKFKSYQFAKRQDTWFHRWDYAKVIEMA